MRRFLLIVSAGILLVGAPVALRAQEPAPPKVDSIRVEGNRRLSSSQIIGSSGIIVHQPVNYRDIQRAITSLFRTGQFDDVLVEQRNVGGRLILVIKVKERPVLEKWAVRGVNRRVGGRRQGPGAPDARAARWIGMRSSRRGRASTRCTRTKATTPRR